MKNIRMLLLPVMVIAGSLCATSQKERIEELARIFHYAAKNCHNLSDPYFLVNLVEDDAAQMTAGDMLSVLEHKDNDGNDPISVSRRKSYHNSCISYTGLLEDMHEMVKCLNSVPEASKLTMHELEEKMEKDENFRAKMDSARDQAKANKHK